MTADLSAGKIDAAFPVGGGLYYAEENDMYQSNPVVSAATELVYKGEYNEEKTRHFAVNENNRMQYYYIRTHYPEAEITGYPSIEECLHAVSAGKAGTTTLNGLRANDILKNSRYQGLSMLQLSFEDERCFGVHIGNEGLLKLLNRGLSVVGEEYAQNMAYLYTDLLYSYTTMDMIRSHIGFFASIILGVAALVILFLVRDAGRTRREIKNREAVHLEMEEKNRELAKSQEALKDALAAAESASRAKTVFLNNMSHDIRTPMNAIVGFTALAEARIDNKELVRDYLEKISVSGRHLLALINDVLDMSRIESGKMRLEEKAVNLPDLIRDIRSIVEEDMEAKKQVFTIQMEQMAHENVISDRLRLSQIFLNILSNVMKFTPEGGSIRFAIAEKDSGNPERTGYEFRIRDNGIGMSEEFRKTVFESFTREKTSTVSGIQGTGLGMAITKNIVDMMGGTIRVESEAGKGSEFIVYLPFRIAENPPEENDRKGREEGLSFREEKKNASETAGFTGKRLLLAEDNLMNQQIALAILEDAGFAVDIAEDGEVAVDKMKQSAAGTYDVILMDIQMPRMDGYEAARQIRRLADPAKAAVPIAAVTANAFEEDKKLAMEAGMDGHLAKPYDIPAMMKTLREMLAR